MPDDKLEPCPFCGTEPKIFQTEIRITCGNFSSCPVRPSVNSNDRDVAVSRWNTRPADADNQEPAKPGNPVDVETGEVRRDDSAVIAQSMCLACAVSSGRYSAVTGGRYNQHFEHTCLSLQPTAAPEAVQE